MGRTTKNTINKFVVFGLIGLLCFFYLFKQYSGSLVLREKDRINIGVYADIPYVYSYHPGKKLAIVTYFNPDYLVKVPGGYDWYKIGSLGLLGKIEDNREKILKQAFSELVGTPIDYLYYPQNARLLRNNKQNFEDYYLQFNNQTLFSKKFTNSITNLFDKLLIKRVFSVRRDHLIFINSYNLVTSRDAREYYEAEKLDGKLKGLFYHESLLNLALKAVVAVNKDNYPKATRVVRQIESLGIKVIEIEINDNLKNSKCVITVNKQQQKALRKLGRIFNCQIKTHKSTIIKYTL